ncbi:hypothetical protein N3K66_008441 [Trichothecium roseum]|uniref:Uncharacterized protein n=1 Tax=Trichothecium roseum TaxID=47278 RepID=A0ACC0UQ78_9HYPO|nr:hypothetical protein N3K66_008441 [Trichothecium roseum]
MDGLTTAVSLFQFAMETLSRIQLARDFEQQFETYQLKLDIIQLRLSRWGQVADLAALDKAEGARGPGDGEDGGPTTMSVLQDIWRLLKSTGRRATSESNKQNGGDDHQGNVLDPEVCMPSDLQMLRARFTGFCRRRRVQAQKGVDALRWVFYKKEQFSDFVGDISDLVDQLEQLLSDEGREKLNELSQDECKGMSKASLKDLRDIVEGCDPWLSKSIETSLESRRSGTSIHQSHNRGYTVGIHKGDNKGCLWGPNKGQISQTFH